jgi:lipopolysaccharide export LptBFGC system permease protein LptF
MRGILKEIANALYLFTVIGGGLAAWVVFNSLMAMGEYGQPDYSALIAVTLPIIPYCMARAVDGMRRNYYPSAPEVGEG